MSERDHFSAALDEHVVDEHPNVTDHAADDVAEIETFDTEPKKKRSIPTPVLLAGGAVLVMAAMFGYKHLKSKPDAQFSNAPVAALPSDTGGMIPNTAASSPLPPQATATDATQGGASPLPAQANPGIPTGPVPTVASASTTTDVAGSKANGLPLDMGASSPTTSAAATAASAVAAVTPPASSALIGAAGGILTGASSVTTAAPAVAAANNAQAPDAKDAEIRKLKRELKAARIALANRSPHGNKGAAVATVAQSDTSASDDAESTTEAPVKKATTHARHTGKHKRRGVEVQLGYHIKQVIPGQGWIVDEESGKQSVVSVGDKIGTSEVTRIDADNYKIYTTAGVIQ
ncbi:hypothetical protein KDX23_23265 [Burkholderia vietnamiensis]|uniref:hypothetical protein n=1 Tax=Burkholderia vietnamiensis TaxID=60552 RepID=UPI001B9E6EEA|nr:hypothetical protein [Burkholderia vietnamiensis]MBR8085661.1 hypothetical protein [Burkholderia vietnamiensis]